MMWYVIGYKTHNGIAYTSILCIRLFKNWYEIYSQGHTSRGTILWSVHIDTFIIEEASHCLWENIYIEKLIWHAYIMPVNFRGKFIVATCKINDFLAILLEINWIINKWIKNIHRFRVYNHSSTHGRWCIAKLKILPESVENFY